MPKPFDLNHAVDEHRGLAARIDDQTTPSGTRKQLEKLVAEHRAAYVRWNGGDELAEIAFGEYNPDDGE